MLTVVLLCVSICVCVALLVRARIRQAKAPDLPPAFPGLLPVIGHSHYLFGDTKNLWPLVNRISKHCVSHGGLSYAKFGSYIHYFVADPEDALTVANSCMEKHSLFQFANDFIGSGLIASSKETYKRHRKLLNPAFTAPVVHSFLNVFNSQAKKLVKELDQHTDTGLFDPVNIFKHMAMESSCLTVFGSGIKDKTFLQSYIWAMNEIANLLTQRFQKYHLHTDFMFKISGWKKRQDYLINTIRKLSNEVMLEKKTAMKEHGYDSTKNKELQYKPYMDFLLELSLNGLLTDREVLEEVDTNIIASFDTTTFTLAMMSCVLGTYPVIQDKIYEEIKQVLGNDTIDRDIEKEDIQKLVYTKAVIKESLRFFPSVPLTARYVDKEVKLKNYTLRADTQCVISNLGMHYHPIWGPDADKFRPERWLESTASVPTNYFSAFSMGKRSCIGMTYAMTIIPIVLVHMVRQYRWTGDYTKMVLKGDVSLKPDSGNEISIQRRRRQ